MELDTILSRFQQQALAYFKKTSLVKHFYLAGGTALAEYYLHHRKSEDLDFFTQEELSIKILRDFSTQLQTLMPMDKVEYQHGFGLYSFFFSPKGEVAQYKIDFGQYPFGPIEPLRLIDKLHIESLYDIAVDKAHTISVRPRLRDFIDLYSILDREKTWKFEALIQKSQEKFEIVVDPFQLGENLLQVNQLIDMPIMLKPVNLKAVRTFFLFQAKQLQKRIFT
ncbi:hypothetical protein A2W24_00635 [Microgenomates group bacterium RBG_16_45_19]|nr:MAG: hypothetical protein A2W24_00635 [Microgenomates group bacterium RBG_16_45_19]